MRNSKGMYKGGVAILEHARTQHHIKQIERVGHRILKIMLSTKNAVAPIAVLATYAPHSGYTVGGSTRRWNLAQETIEQMPYREEM